MCLHLAERDEPRSHPYRVAQILDVMFASRSTTPNQECDVNYVKASIYQEFQTLLLNRGGYYNHDMFQVGKDKLLRKEVSCVLSTI